MRLPLLLIALLTATLAHARPMIDLGIDTLRREGFAHLEGKRVGLLTHPAGVDKNGVPTWQILKAAPEVNLVALYGPEHGLEGLAVANEKVGHATHRPSGLPAYSLYGEHRKPSPEMLREIDIMVVDLQSVGTRSYTYISCMKLAMAACFENNVEFMVLDRPNPLGGLKVDGPGLDPAWKSYVGEFEVPYVYGMTIGELAVMCKKAPGVLGVSESIRERGRLYVVPMGGWKRWMLWPDTGLTWVQTSPAVPDLSAAMGYPMTGLGTYVGKWSHGVGTQYNFRLLSYSGVSPEAVYRALAAARIPGLGFQPATGQNKAGTDFPGVYLTIDDWNALPTTAVSFYMMRLACQWSDENPFVHIGDKKRGFLIHMGDPAWLEELQTRGANARVEMFLEKWRREALEFQNRSRQYWLYR